MSYSMALSWNYTMMLPMTEANPCLILWSYHGLIPSICQWQKLVYVNSCPMSYIMLSLSVAGSCLIMVISWSYTIHVINGSSWSMPYIMVILWSYTLCVINPGTYILLQGYQHTS